MTTQLFDHFLPEPARVAAIQVESEETRTFVLKLQSPSLAFDGARPGQFAMLSVLGKGEAAFTLSSLAGFGTDPGTVVMTVRKVGCLTTALFDLHEGALVGVRGPFGRGFPQDDYSLPTLYVAGGCGLSPLKAAIDVHIARRPEWSRLAIIYGARDPAVRIHRHALAAWAYMPGVSVIECVDHPTPRWSGKTGVVADFIGDAVATIGAKRAAVCGPSLMLTTAARALHQSGLDPDNIFVAVERYMKCGTGHCGHCYINGRYVCRDGPVFSLTELRQLPDSRAEAGV